MHTFFDRSFKGRTLFVALMFLIAVAGIGWHINVINASQSVVYSNTFSDASSIASWIPYGKHPKPWKIQDGALVSPSGEKTQGIKGTDTPMLSDFEAKFSIRFNHKDSEGGLLFRLQSDGSGYLLKLDPEDNRWKLSSVNAHAKDETIIKGKVKIDAKRWYDADVAVRNNRLTFKLNGQTIAEFNLPSMYPSGNFGFWREDDKVQFDNLEILKEDIVVPTPEPTVMHVPLASSMLSNGAGVPLYRFTVAANQAGDVGLYKFSFILNTSTATVTNIRLYEEPDTFSTNLTMNGPRNITQTFTPASGNPLNNGSYGIDVLFDTGNDGIASGGEYRIVPAGGARTYELRGDVVGVFPGSRVETRLLNDPVQDFTNYKSAIEVDHAPNDNFIWSDLHFGNNSTTATVTAEWMNGFDVPGLDSVGSQVSTK